MTNKEKINILVKEWMKKAKEDLITAETLLEAPEKKLSFLTSTMGFHSQQCVEKSLKAFLIYKQIEFRRSHDIKYLLNLCKEETDKFEVIRNNSSLLNDYAVEARYPEDYEEFTTKESIKAVNVARRVLNLLEEVIPEVTE